MTRLASRAAVLLALAGLWGAAAPSASAEPQDGGDDPPGARAASDTGRSAVARPDTSLFPIIDFVPDTTFVADTSVVFAIETGSRLYPEWKEEHRVHIDEHFPIGDTEFSAVVTRFLPDFRLVDGRPVSASRRLANPAIHVFTSRDTTVADSGWAFLNFPPHFSPRAFFTYRLKEVLGYTGDPDSAAASEAAEGKPAEGKKTNANRKAAKAKESVSKAEGGTPE